MLKLCFFFFFQAEDGIRDGHVTGVQTCALPISPICCDVLIRPEASPASAGTTPASAAIEIGTNEKPRPTAISRKPGSRSPRYDPPTDTCVKETSPAVS